MCLWEFFFGRPPAKMYWMDDYVATEKDFQVTPPLPITFTPAQLLVLWNIFPHRNRIHPQEMALICDQVVKCFKSYKEYWQSRYKSGAPLDESEEVFYMCVFNTYYN